MASVARQHFGTPLNSVAVRPVPMEDSLLGFRWDVAQVFRLALHTALCLDVGRAPVDETPLVPSDTPAGPPVVKS